MKSFTHVLLLVFICLTTTLLGQNVVSGTVTSASSGDALIGATVRAKGTNKGTTTDLNGRYTIEMPAGASTLVFSYVGTESQEVVVRGNTIDVKLSDGYEVKEIVVIGSRNQTRTKLETPVAVDVIPIQNVINEVGQVDVNQILTYIAPSFQSSRQAIADGTDHVDPAQLRGLGPDQVLVLVNGKRRHQSALVNVNGTVNRGTVGTDMNAIPATSIERIEILRDGAAAQYGSDAIAGVINIVTKTSTGKLDINASGGQYMTEYAKNYAFNKINNIAENPNVSVTDGQTMAVGANYGFKVGSKGFINLTGEYSKRGETNRTGLFTGRLYPLVSGQNRDDSILKAKNLTREFFDMRIGNSEVQSYGAVLNSGFDISNNFELYILGTYNKKEGNAAGFYRYPIYTADILNKTNAKAIYPDGFLPNINSDVTDLSGTVGLRGKLGAWNADLSQTYGSNSFDFGVSNSINYSQNPIGKADAQKEFNAGGLSFTQLTSNLDLSKLYDNVANGLNVAAGAEFRIDGFEITAGEEASYKNFDSSLGVAGGAQVFAGFKPLDASKNNRSAVAGYLDLELDLTENFMVGAAVRAENYSDFGSTVNYKGVARWKILDKVALRGAVSTGFRAPSQQQKYYSRTSTLFVNVAGTLTPVESGTFTNDSKFAEIFGIPELKQETSQNYSAGITLNPASGLEITLDAYHIAIDDRIVLTNNFGANGNADLAAQLAAQGATTANFFTNAINTKSKGLEAVVNYTFKFSGGQELRAVLAGSIIDNEVEKAADGRPLINSTEILENTGQVGNYFNREDQSRIEVANPRSKGSLTLNYKTGKLGILLRNSYWGKVTYLAPEDLNTRATWPKVNGVPSSATFANAFNGGKLEPLDQVFSPKLVTDVTINYQLLKQLNLAIGANNLFDIYQDQHKHSTNMGAGRFVYSRRVQQMGFNGRYVFARLRVTL
jgi:iron complex outermembrane recepter protein